MGDWASLYGNLSSSVDKGNQMEQPTMFSDDYFVREEVGSMHFQYKGQYIISATNSGLMIIDQHRAHVRILYDRYIGQMSKQENVSQGLLFPELLTLPPSDAHVLEQIMDDLHHLGFLFRQYYKHVLNTVQIPPQSHHYYHPYIHLRQTPAPAQMHRI